jgi:uncharacterized membrane protein
MENENNAPSVAETNPKTDKTPQGEKILATLGYLSFFCILPLVLKPNSKFCQFHGKQALVITLVFFLLSWLGWVSAIFGFLITLVHIGVAITGLVSAAQGTKFKIPIIIDMAKKLVW